MILLSVGTQLPFDRLTKTVDEWAARHDRDDVVAQIGPTSYKPTAMKSFAFLDHDRFRTLQEECSVFVSHAGMGSIITAMELRKPIVILARDHRRGEHRNGHQLATIRQFIRTAGVYPAESEAEVTKLLDQADSLAPPPGLSSTASADFIGRLESYVHESLRPTLWQKLRGRVD